jgi:hypothetical protein
LFQQKCPVLSKPDALQLSLKPMRHRAKHKALKALFCGACAVLLMATLLPPPRAEGCAAASASPHNDAACARCPNCRARHDRETPNLSKPTCCTKEEETPKAPARCCAEETTHGTAVAPASCPCDMTRGDAPAAPVLPLVQPTAPKPASDKQCLALLRLHADTPACLRAAPSTVPLLSLRTTPTLPEICIFRC